MSNADRLKWDERYREGSYEGREYPTELLEQWLPRLPRGRALDIACGAGRNAFHLAAHGYQVDAIDISVEAIKRARGTALSRGLEVNWIVADLDDAPLPPETYDVIFIARFIHRDLLPRAKEALKEGGVFLFEHHLISKAPVGGPQNREFRLRPNELLHLLWDLRVLHYREHLGRDRDGRCMALAEIVACKGDCGF